MLPEGYTVCYFIIIIIIFLEVRVIGWTAVAMLEVALFGFHRA